MAIPEVAGPVRPGTVRRSLLVSDQPALVRMAAGLDFLLGYPYGCTEQRISRAGQSDSPAVQELSRELWEGLIIRLYQGNEIYGGLQRRRDRQSASSRRSRVARRTGFGSSSTEKPKRSRSDRSLRLAGW